jgi:hypothetical protein
LSSGARSSASATSSDVEVISRLQIGHSLRRVVNHGVLKPPSAAVTERGGMFVRGGGVGTCKLGGIRGHKGE